MGYLTKQKGYGLFQFMFTMSILVMAMLVLTKIVPIYLQDYGINKILLNANRDLHISSLSVDEAQASIIKAFEINGITDIPPEAISLNALDYGLEVSLHYEVRKNIVGNLDVVVSFNDEILLRNE